jgi:hypothetical protein
MYYYLFRGDALKKYIGLEMIRYIPKTLFVYQN